MERFTGQFFWVTHKVGNLIGAGETYSMPEEKHQNIPLPQGRNAEFPKALFHEKVERLLWLHYAGRTFRFKLVRIIPVTDPLYP